METGKHQIAAPQFFVMVFVSQAVTLMGVNARVLGGENMLEAIVSCALAMLLGIVAALPVWALHRRYPDLDIGTAAQAAAGRAGKAVPLLYILYFVLVNGASLGLLQIFLLDTVNPEFSAALAVAAVLAAALYGAFRGIETVARCAVCVFAVLLLGTALVAGITAFRFDPENLEPVFANGLSQTARGTALFLARTSIFADMAVLLPMVRGRKVKGFLGWAGGTALFGGIFFLLLAGCLGPYASTQNFPVFTLSSITEVRSMQRLDAVFVGVWMMGLTVRTACDVYACRVCFASLCGKKLPKASTFLAGGAILLLAFAVVEFQGVQRALLDTRLLLICTGISAVLPLPVLVCGLFRREKRKGAN